MSVSLVILAGKLEMCFDISINTNEISSDSIKQFLLVLGGLYNGTLVVPGRNVSISFNIRNRNNGIIIYIQNNLNCFTQNRSTYTLKSIKSAECCT